MNTYIRQISLLALITLLITLSTAAQSQTRAYRVSDRQVQTLLDRIDSGTEALRDQIDRSLDNSSANGSQREDSINTMFGDFENATSRLKNNFTSRRSSADDVQEVLNKAVYINSFMRTNRMTPESQNQWARIRADLNTLGSYYQVSSTWNNNAPLPSNQGGYSVSDDQMRALLYRLRTRNTSFRQSFNRWNNRYYNNGQTTSTGGVSQSMTEFDSALAELSRNFNDRNTGNLDRVMRPSIAINSFIGTNRTNNDVTGKWTLVRNDLNTLASYYRTSWNWNNNPTPGPTYGNFDSRLTGTYRLNTSQSDNASAIVDRAIANSGNQSNNDYRMRGNLERRLGSPETLTFEKRGQEITMSSTNSQAVTITADGVRRSETSPNGRTVTTSATTSGQELMINYEGDRMNDFYLTFTPVSNSQLRVTRRIYLENTDQTVTVASVYDKTSQNPQWNTAQQPIYNGNGNGNGNGRFLIPNNTSIIATLDSALSTRSAKDGDRFSMTVTSPSQYSGAVIQGTVSGQQSGVVSGQAVMSLNFETIRMTDGRTYTFAGIIEQVREVNGNVVRVNNEGAIRDRSQTTQTATRAGVGAVIGAIIGAIAGGGSGAAIGAGVGAGAGAGTVVLQGRDNLDLATGSQFSITSTAPSNVGAN